MQDLTKIATCCYCGTRAVLQLRGRERHELSCANCGAALHNMKPMKTKKAEPPQRPHAAPYPAERPRKQKPPKSYRKPKKRKGWGYMIGEIWDEIEDIFD
ncbi:MAG: hypothetical protein AAFY59_01215 [Pseudomonadota bacterium]